MHIIIPSKSLCVCAHVYKSGDMKVINVLFSFSFLNICSLPCQAKVFICLGDQDLLQKEFKGNKNVLTLHFCIIYNNINNNNCEKECSIFLHLPTRISKDPVHRIFLQCRNDTLLSMAAVTLLEQEVNTQGNQKKNLPLSSQGNGGRKKQREGEMLILFSLQADFIQEGGVCQRKGGSSCPLLPIMRLLPRLSFTNLGCNYINANVAGQCDQAARGSEILLLNHALFLVAGVLS